MEHDVDPCGSSVWFAWKAPASGPVTINYNGLDFWPAVAVYTGTTLSKLVGVAGNSFGNPVNFTAVAGATYQIALAGWYSGSGNYSLDLWLNGGANNDNFANRIALAGTNLNVEANNTGASGQAGEPNPSGSTPSHSLWWSYASPVAGSLLIDFSAASFAVSGVRQSSATRPPVSPLLGL